MRQGWRSVPYGMNSEAATSNQLSRGSLSSLLQQAWHNSLGFQTPGHAAVGDIREALRGAPLDNPFYL
jgi:hypothetical protein